MNQKRTKYEIKNLNPKKSPGYDGLSAKFIRSVANEISEPLSHIFNLTFISGNIPDNLKKALITPVFKANDKNEFKNYRPILTCFSKLLEKLMYKRLIIFIEKNRILTQQQYGSRENRSTELAIIELTSRLTKAIDMENSQQVFSLIYQKHLILLITRFWYKNQNTMA